MQKSRQDLKFSDYSRLQLEDLYILDSKIQSIRFPHEDGKESCWFIRPYLL